MLMAPASATSSFLNLNSNRSSLLSANSNRPKNDYFTGINSEKRIVINASKGEVISKSNGYRNLLARLKKCGNVDVVKTGISDQTLSETSLLILIAPKEKFSASEFSSLRTFISSGGAVLYMGHEAEDSPSSSNFNFLLEEFGMMINSDSVIKTSYSKYYHPKETLISHGVLNREIYRAAGKDMTSIRKSARGSSLDGFSFLYAFGATLNVQPPSIPLLSSGTLSYPVNRPVAGFYLDPVRKGRLLAIGSAAMFSDQYLDKEENELLLSVIVKLLLTDEAQLDMIDAQEPDVSDYHYVPEIASTASNLKACLQDSEELPKDFTRLFDMSLFGFGTNLVPETIKAYEKLKLTHEPLTLIHPQFDAPLPALTPSVFPPLLRDIPAPPLELFDIDEYFASEATKLAQLANKCTDDDIEFFILQCGELLGVKEKLEGEKWNANSVLGHVFDSIVNWKMTSPV